MYIVGIRIGYAKRALSYDSMRNALSGLRSSPTVVQSVLDQASEIEEAAEFIKDSRDIFFIGRNINYPTMLEGALKLKEISYIHAEGFAAGELKHGPLALLDSKTPVIAVCLSKDHTYDKMMANISEVAARDSPVVSIGLENDRELAQISVPDDHRAHHALDLLADTGHHRAAAARLLRGQEKGLLHR